MAIDERPASGPGAARDEFVVALPYGPAVRAALRDDFGLGCELADSAELNLTLVRPEHLGSAAAALAGAARERRGRADTARVLDIVHGNEPGTSPLDDLMFCLRYDFAARCDGWFPPMGKNRDMHTITGQPHLDGGAATVPQAVTAPHRPSRVDPHRGAGVRVGLLDTPLSAHPSLTGRYLAGPDDLLAEREVYPYLAGHATFVAGLVLRRAPAAELHVRHALSEDRATSTVWDVVHQMLRMRADGVRLLNLSLGCHTGDGQPPMVLARAVRLLAPDMVIVAAAGNHGDPTEHHGPSPRSAFWPAAMDDVLAVGADTGDHSGTLAAFSPRLPWVGVTAAGDGVVSTYLDGRVDLGADHGGPARFSGWARWSGTSFAAATVTGELAALVRDGEPTWQAVADLRERAQLNPDGGVRLYAWEPEGAPAG